MELLWALMHLCDGQLVKALELLRIQWKNTVYGGVQNIFIKEGLVTFMAMYYKGY
jgi:hypothetical protein